jgi:DnaJ-domain-containing protein 1
VRESIRRGELVRFAYRLGRQHANGILSILAVSGRETLALRRGLVILGPLGSELDRKALVSRLARLASQDVHVEFEGGVTGVVPPGATRGVNLAAWARAHLEAQLDGSLAETLVRELAGVRLVLSPELAPEPDDEADRRMLAAMTQPRRLDQIWPLARTPKFRLLAFVHFLRSVGAIELEGVAVPRAITPLDHARRAALRVLGIDSSDPDQIKRAYRRLARALHPDLQPTADAERRRALERRFAEVTTAYEALTRSAGA